MIENYVLGRLNAEEESAFEEHLLHCDECKRKCEQVEAIIEASEHSAMDDTKILPVKKKKKTLLVVHFNTLLRVAAALLLLAGAAYFIFHIDKPDYIASDNESNTGISIADTNSYGTRDSSDIMNNQSVKNDRKPIEKLRKKKKEPERMLLAEAFQASPVFESAIQNQLRSQSVSVSSPADSAVFRMDQAIHFVWNTGSEQEITLIIRRNTGKIFFREKVPSAYSQKIDAPGLYYWQLMAGDEILYTGKFTVNDPHFSK